MITCNIFIIVINDCYIFIYIYIYIYIVLPMAGRLLTDSLLSLLL